MHYTIEIATADYRTTALAVEGGADRIELCAGLSEGGTTPSMGTIRRCREAFAVQLFPIIRLRGGDFLYTHEEMQVMQDDVRLSKDLGCDGVVVGMLTTDGQIDREALRRMVDLAYPMEVTFHRAFDRCRDPFEALEVLIEAGCQRLLTSGQQLTAPQGAGLIRRLIAAADGRISIMPGSGVRLENIGALALETGATEFHTSLRGREKSQMDFIHPAFASSEESYMNPFIDPGMVKALRNELDRLPAPTAGNR
jgi:copper homeostasis protein